MNGGQAHLLTIVDGLEDAGNNKSINNKHWIKLYKSCTTSDQLIPKM